MAAGRSPLLTEQSTMQDLGGRYTVRGFRLFLELPLGLDIGFWGSRSRALGFIGCRSRLQDPDARLPGQGNRASDLVQERARDVDLGAKMTKEETFTKRALES